MKVLDIKVSKVSDAQRGTVVERKWANVEGKRERNKVNKTVKEKWRKETLDGGKIEK